MPALQLGPVILSRISLMNFVFERGTPGLLAASCPPRLRLPQSILSFLLSRSDRHACSIVSQMSMFELNKYL